MEGGAAAKGSRHPPAVAHGEFQQAVPASTWVGPAASDCLQQRIGTADQRRLGERRGAGSAFDVARRNGSAAVLANQLPAQVLHADMQGAAARRALLYEVRRLRHRGISFYRLPDHNPTAYRMRMVWLIQQNWRHL